VDPDKIMDGISKEIESAFKAMKKAKNPEEKLIQSKIIKNLCESLGVFLELLHTIGPDDGDEIPF
jgi:hypothetical protein